jgi:hypothetical protein
MKASWQAITARHLLQGFEGIRFGYGAPFSLD